MTISASETLAPPAPTTRSPRRAPVVVVALVAYGLFVLVRLFMHGGDPTVFVAAGDRVTNPRQAPGLTVAHHSDGYDGQYFHRLARNPLTTAKTEFGTTLDRPAYRQQRIGYPALVWLVSGGGRAGVVPWALIGVNLVAVGALAAVAAELARAAGRSPWLALAAVGWPGLMIGLARDLSEVLAGTLLLAAVLALRRERWVVAATVLVAAALTRETTLLLAAGIVGAWALGRLGVLAYRRGEQVPAPYAAQASSGVPQSRWAIARYARTVAGEDGERAVPLWVGVLPIAAAAAWHVALAVRWRGVPLTGAKTPSFIGVPVLALLRQLASWAIHPDPVGLVQLVQVAILLFVVLTLAAALVDPGAGRPHERLALVGAVAVISMLPAWDRNVVFLRWADEAVLIGFAVALGAKRLDWRAIGRATALLWLITGVIWISIA